MATSQLNRRYNEDEDRWWGEHRECELCEEVKSCLRYCGLMTCQECQEKYLPARGLF